MLRSGCPRTVCAMAALFLLSAAAVARAAPGEPTAAQLCAPLAPQAAAGSDLGDLIGERLADIERDLDGRLDGLDRVAGTPYAPSGEEITADADRLQRYLRFLDGRIATLEPGEARVLRCRSRVLRLRAGNLKALSERSAAQAPDGRSAPAVEPRGLGGLAGRVTNAASGAGLEGVEVDIWRISGLLAAQTFTDSSGDYSVLGLDDGTYYATTHNEAGFIDELYNNIPCPGGALGGCSPETGTAIVVFAAQVTAGVDFALGPGGVISGRLSEAITGLAIAGATVEVWKSNGLLVDSTSTDAAGDYSLGGLVSGTYFAVAHSSEHRDELYDDIPCPGGCDPTSGTPIAVVTGASTPGIDFTLDRLGSISGTVVDAATGDPLPFVEVDIVDGSGEDVAYGETDGSGHYQAGGIDAGTFFAYTFFASNYRDEVYDDIPCSPCNPTAGTPIGVSLNSDTGGIDFALERLGTISGTVTDAATGKPLSSVSVFVFDSEGVWSGLWSTDSSGHYATGGWTPGNYFLKAESSTHLDELYDGIPCEGFLGGGCDPTTGTPVAVALNSDTVGIDFALERLGTISGVVTDATTGDPVTDATVGVYDSSGSGVGGARTDASGHYIAEGLVDGTYFVLAYSLSHRPELYDDIPCIRCDPTIGTSVAVALNSNTGGIDFALERNGTISGTVTDAITGERLSSVWIYIWDSRGLLIVTGLTDSLGHFATFGLLDGTYYAAAFSSSHALELYDHVPCTGGGFPGCDPRTGTPIPVIFNTDTGGIDFALDRLGTVAGTVTDAATGEPLGSVEVQVWDSFGVSAGSVLTDSSGHFQTDGLADGSYFLTTRNTSTYIDELYDDLPCPGGAYPGCIPTTGTPIPVALHTDTVDIDFALDFGSGIAGTVTDQGTSAPIPGVAIDLWDLAGGHLASVATDARGNYRFAMPAGGYYLSTDNDQGYRDEVFDDVPCPLGPAFAGLCDPTAGSLVVVPTDQPAVPGRDFALEPVSSVIFSDGFERGDLSRWSAAVLN